MSTTVKMTVPEMVGFLKTVGTSCMFLSMDTQTVLKRGKQIKVSCPFGDVTKSCTRLGWLNIKYNDAVRRRIAAKLGVEPKDVEYTSGDVWHKHIMTEDGKMTPVLVHKEKDNGKFYMFYFHRKTKGTVYTAANGDTLTYEQIKPYFYANGASREDFKPEVRSVTINNIRTLKARGLVLLKG